MRFSYMYTCDKCHAVFSFTPENKDAAVVCTTQRVGKPPCNNVATRVKCKPYANRDKQPEG